MFDFVSEWYLNTREFAFFFLVAVLVIVEGIYLAYLFEVSRGWAFVMGVAAAIGLVILSNELSNMAEERVGNDA